MPQKEYIFVSFTEVKWTYSRCFKFMKSDGGVQLCDPPTDTTPGVSVTPEVSHAFWQLISAPLTPTRVRSFAFSRLEQIEWYSL